MKYNFLLTALVFFYTNPILSQSQKVIITSPDKKLSAQVWIGNDKHAFYSVALNNQPQLTISKLGIICEDEDYSKELSLLSISPSEIVTDKYETFNAKRRINIYKASKRIIHLQNSSGKRMDIIFQVSNDGVAFRYYFPGKASDIKKIKEEITSFHFPKDTKAWMQPMQESKSGFEHSNPAYEEYYQKEINVGTPAPGKAGWVYPALFKTGNSWALITEGSLDGTYCATRLQQNSPDGEYVVGFPQDTEIFPGGVLGPQSVLPWYSPWRIVAIGSLKTLVESTLGTDMAQPSIKMDRSFIKPGIASWSWVLLKDDSTVYNVQKEFIDYAYDMHWQYCLIDAAWDKKIGYEKVKELADYASRKHVGLLLWYNSAGSWNTVKFTPRDKLLTHEDRIKEFSRLQQMGIKGVKVDFFGGDGQSMIQYYIDIFKDAADYKLMVNCHGATLPRGWQRTYPNLVSMEAIKGMEFITFEQANTDEEPFHATTIPFTRNLFDPMDFTPMCLYKIPKKQRRTSSAFELALPVVFLSGIQHLAETPAGMAHEPAYVKEFLRNIPASWDDSKFIDGYPGKYFVVARKGNNKWIIAGINGEKKDREVRMDLNFLSPDSKIVLISDGDDETSFSTRELELPKDKKINITMKGNGGFVMVIKSSKSSIIADGAKLQMISDQFSFTEGPAVDKTGNVYFTDQPNNKIWKYGTDGKLSVFMENAGRSNGMYFDKKGNLITCADEQDQLWSIAPNGKVTVLLKDLNGLHFNGPNDLWIRPDGGIYFTDPYYQRPYWTRQAPEIEKQNVYFLQQNKLPVAVDDDLEKPNGIIGTPDGKYLYVADIKADKTYKYTIAPDGTLSDKTLFASKGSDGMTIDRMGNIYITGNGVTVYDKQGNFIDHIDVPGAWTANITFGGKEKNLLFITASKAVYILKMKVKGVQ